MKKLHLLLLFSIFMGSSIFATAQQVISITTADGTYGADNRVLVGADPAAGNPQTVWSSWINAATGASNKDGGMINISPKYMYCMYLRFDLTSLVGKTATDASLIFNCVNSTARSNIKLYALEDKYAGGRDWSGYIDEEGEFYIEKHATNGSGWTPVFDQTAGTFNPGFEKVLCADSAPGLEEGAAADELDGNYNYFSTVLKPIGAKFSRPDGATTVTINHSDLLQAIKDDTNKTIVLVVATESKPTGIFPEEFVDMITKEQDITKAAALKVTVDGVTAIAKPKKNGFVTFNSTLIGDELILSSSLKSFDKIEVFSITGELVITKSSLNSTQTTINFSNQKTGIYYVKTFSLDGISVDIKKVIKK